MNETIMHDAERFGAVRVESKNLDVLILRRLPYAKKNFSGQLCQWELEYRWLSQMDPALCCVMGQEYTLYPRADINPKKSLFTQFNLF